MEPLTDAEMQAKMKKLEKEAAVMLETMSEITAKPQTIMTEDFSMARRGKEKPFRKDNVFRYYDPDKSYAYVRKVFMWMRRNKELVCQNEKLEKDALQLVIDLSKVRFDLKGASEDFGFGVTDADLNTLTYMKIVPWHFGEVIPWALYWCYQTTEPGKRGAAVLDYLDKINETFVPRDFEVILTHVPVKQLEVFLKEMEAVLEAKEDQDNIYTKITLEWVKGFLAELNNVKMPEDDS